jgi:K+-transporting ATPase A subunit
VNNEYKYIPHFNLSTVTTRLFFGGILATLVVLVVTAVMIFPVLIQGPIEAQDNGFILNICP